jgi:cytochrome oxidase Cu insertion factor (SCO1/SenC/PrrC family)
MGGVRGVVETAKPHEFLAKTAKPHYFFAQNRKTARKIGQNRKSVEEFFFYNNQTIHRHGEGMVRHSNIFYLLIFHYVQTNIPSFGLEYPNGG